MHIPDDVFRDGPSNAPPIYMARDPCIRKEASAKRKTYVLPQLSHPIVHTSSVSDLRCTLLNLCDCCATVTVNTFQAMSSFFNNDSIFQNQPRYPYQAFFKRFPTLGFNLITVSCSRLTLEADRAGVRALSTSCMRVSPDMCVCTI